MNTLIEDYEYKGHKVSIHYDEDAESPRTWDNLGTMVAFHSRYNLGDEDHGYTQEQAVEMWEKRELYEDFFILPLYLYDHGGIMMSTKRDFLFRCPWDSMQVGLIFVHRKKALEWFQRKRMSKKLTELIYRCLAAEVQTYNQYLTGSVLGYVIEREGEHVDSCWGYYGDPEEHMQPEIESIIDTITAEQVGLIYPE
jgi:hypothetical protein